MERRKEILKTETRKAGEKLRDFAPWTGVSIGVIGFYAGCITIAENPGSAIIGLSIMIASAVLAIGIARLMRAIGCAVEYVALDPKSSAEPHQSFTDPFEFEFDEDDDDDEDYESFDEFMTRMIEEKRERDRHTLEQLDILEELYDKDHITSEEYVDKLRDMCTSSEEAREIVHSGVDAETKILMLRVLCRKELTQ